MDLGVDRVYGNARLRELTGTELLQRLQKLSSRPDAPLFRAMEAMGWMREGFDLLRGLTVVEELAASFDPDQRALVMQDTAEWRQHWNSYLRTRPEGSHNASSFLSQVALGATQQANHEGVAFLTVHSAKGMEFDVVFMIAMNEGVFPDYRAKGHALEEEQRNAFVAVTRSRRLLYVSCQRERMMPWGESKAQKPSRFIKSL